MLKNTGAKNGKMMFGLTGPEYLDWWGNRSVDYGEYATLQEACENACTYFDFENHCPRKYSIDVLHEEDNPYTQNWWYMYFKYDPGWDSGRWVDCEGDVYDPDTDTWTVYNCRTNTWRKWNSGHWDDCEGYAYHYKTNTWRKKA